MKLEIGKTYIVKSANSGVIRAKFLGAVERRWRYDSRLRKHYLFENLGTGRTIEVKSLSRVRGLAESQEAINAMVARVMAAKSGIVREVAGRIGLPVIDVPLA